MRPEQLRAAPGPQAAVMVGYVAAGAPSLVVAPVAAHDGLDAATLQFLLQQSLLAVAVEEEEAKEVAKLRELEEQVSGAGAAGGGGAGAAGAHARQDQPLHLVWLRLWMGSRKEGPSEGPPPANCGIQMLGAVVPWSSSSSSSNPS